MSLQRSRPLTRQALTTLDPNPMGRPLSGGSFGLRLIRKSNKIRSFWAMTVPRAPGRPYSGAVGKGPHRSMAVYLDCAATAPVDSRVQREVMTYLHVEFGNAGSRHHGFGTRARSAVEKARVRVSASVAATRGEIVFTSGATESNLLQNFDPHRSNPCESTRQSVRRWETGSTT